MISLSIIIPIYNESNNLKKLSNLINKNVKLKKFEVIFIDDNSSDGSLDILKKINKKNKKIKYLIRKEKIRDLSKSCFLGFSKSKYNNILVMDGDLQHDPKDINKLINNFNSQGADVVVGSRNFYGFKRVKGLSFSRFLASKFLILIVKFLLGKKTNDPMSGFFLFKKRLLKKAKTLNKIGYKILLDLIYSIDNNIKVVDVKINFKVRNTGNSKMNLKILFLLVYVIIVKSISNIFKR